MPIVTATPRGQANGQVLTEFTDSVGTSNVTYTYPARQEWLAVKNIGTQPITVIVGGASQMIQPGVRWENSGDFTDFSIVSESGVQAFEAVADKKGNEFDSPEGRFLASSDSRVPLLNSVSGSSRLRRAENRVILTHLNGTPASVSAGVTTTQTSPREMDINLPGAAAYSIAINATKPVNPIPNQYIDVVMETPDWNLITNVELRIIPNSASASNYYYYNFNPTFSLPRKPPNTPVLFRRHKDEFGVNGAPSAFGLTATGQIIIVITSTAATKLKVWNGVVSTNPMCPVAIMFDDWNKGVYDYAFPAMKKRGIPGTFFVVRDQVGLAGNIKWNHLIEMQEAGWTIGNHTSNHINLKTATVNDAIDAVEQGAAALAQRGLRGGNFLAAPLNEMDSTRDVYLSHAANIFRVGLGASGTDAVGNKLMKQSSLAYLRGYSAQNTDTPSALFNNYYVPAKNKCLMFAYTFHVIKPIGDATTQYQYNIDKFEQLLDLLVSDDAIFTTVEEYARAYLSTVEDIPGYLRF